MTTYRKKLIEVAMPLEAINVGVQKEKKIHTGLPANLHTWWSRKPLGAARAILFASLVDYPEESISDDDVKYRNHLFKIVGALADPSATQNKALLDEARKIITDTFGKDIPVFWDPFCGGGSLPLEAARLGLRSIGSDLNPVAVFITRVMLELAPPQKTHASVNPEASCDEKSNNTPFEGLSKDIDYYSKQVLEKAKKKIGDAYPDIVLPTEYGGLKARVVAWIWARTVTCPNPSCGVTSPLVNKFWLSTHCKNKAWVEPIMQHNCKRFSFIVHRGDGHPTEGTVSKKGAICLSCGTAIPFDYIRSEGSMGGLGYQLMGVSAEGPNGRVYVSPNQDHERAATSCTPNWKPETELPDSALGFRVQNYGILKHKDLFTNRQLLLLDVFSEAIREVFLEIQIDSKHDKEYSTLIASFLALSLSRLAQTNNTLVRWLIRTSGTSKGTPAFDRQIVSMVWEFSEGNVFSNSVGSWTAAVKNPLTTLKSLYTIDRQGVAIQKDASVGIEQQRLAVICTDPPYYDAIGYADLSDFYYIWLRKTLSDVIPDLFRTILTPKKEDLSAQLGRKNIDREEANKNFLERLHSAFKVMRENSYPDIPITIFYAFKQTENSSLGSNRKKRKTSAGATGWDVFLSSVIAAGFQITGTWPVRTESLTRPRALASNALASTIVLVCRKRPDNAPITTRAEFLKTLKREVPSAIKLLQQGNIAPVDMAQAAIGPGMAVFTRYKKVLESDDTPMNVRTALQLINEVLDETLCERENDFDADTRFAITWFQSHGMSTGAYGDAEGLAKARNVSVDGIVEAGIIESRGGKVRILKRNEMLDDWDPATDNRLTVWECTQYLIRTMENDGETAAANLLARLNSRGDAAKDLAYRLYGICERNKWSEEARAYNALVTAWPELKTLSAQSDAKPGPDQSELNI